MYTEQNKGFTIITNFGCKNNCSYCITKHHPILKNQLTDLDAFDWEKLEHYISQTDAPNVNLSGGGDPLFNYNEHMDFYNRVYALCQKYNKGLDVHTRVIGDSPKLWKLFRKMAISIEYTDNEAFEELKAKIEEMQKFTEIRVIQVVDSKITREDCLYYIHKFGDIGVKQITFRQMFGNKAAYEHFKELAAYDWPKGVLFLKDGEYHNYYFSNNNTLYPFFFGNSVDDRMYWKKRYEDIEQSCT